MVQLKRNLLSMALASATFMMATAAYAQDGAQAQPGQTDQQQATDANAKTLDEVVVTGIRAAIESAIETKQSSTSIVEAISAEDIGKLPDTSIADSIARLPGLTAQRFGNRPQEINIRGFAGDFSTGLLNGREQVSLSNNRGVEFDQYPAELVNQVVVYKTTDGSLIGQGLSGTVDLRTVRPLSFSDRVIAVNLRGDMNEIENGDEQYGNRFSVSYIDQFADNTIGLSLGYARLNNPNQGHEFEAWGYDDGVINGGNLFAIDRDNTRDGFMGTLEFKPNDMYSTTLDLFYSKFDKEEDKKGLQFATGSWTGATVSNRIDNENGTATTANFDNFNFAVVRNDYNAAKDDLFAIGWNHELKLSDHWTVRADISNSSAKRDERILETYARLAPGTSTTAGAVLNNDGYFDMSFGVDFGDPANLRMMDPGGWGGDRAQAGYLKDFEVKDELTSFRLDAERSFDSGWFSSVEFGANITDRQKSRASTENTLCLTAGCTAAENAGVPVPSQYANGTDFGIFGVESVYGLDALAMVNDGFYILRPKQHGDIDNKNWEVEETVSTFFIQGNINTDLGSVPVRGNIGVQVVTADQSSTGVATFAGVALDEPSTRGATHTDVLPSLNLSFQLPWEQFVRFGASRQMARPRMDQLRANADYNFDAAQQAWSGDGGNPELEPWLANAYDLSWEKYFSGTRAYVSAAYFYKDLETYIYDEVDTNFDFGQLPIPPGLIPPGGSVDMIGTFTQPKNGNGGVVKGHELAVSIPFDLLWDPLEGFGIQANYSDTDSSIQPLGPGFPDEPLPGLSKYVSNVTLYFERWGFSVRGSQRHRSDFLGEVQGFGGDREKIAIEGETVTDVQLGYTIQSGPMKDLSFLLQVNNLENEPFKTTFDGQDDRPRRFNEYGRTFLFGINYKF
jgi:iron complex outermembrane receptor protein